MTTSEKETCRRCGAAVRGTSTERLCAACLMSGVLRHGGGGETLSMAAGESVRSGYSEFPCEFGGYRLLGLLGRGGMGTVYEAEQTGTGRRVALKMLGEQLDSAEMRQRFLREGRLAAEVNHPNSLYVFGSEEVEGLPVITMEVAGGGTLKDTLKERGPLGVAEAVDAMLDVISGLEAAFARGVLHRDIKPSNCFVCPDGSVKVGDFGLSVSTLAKGDTFMTAHGRIMGTPAYASPEQLRGDTLDVRADIYSVGATLYTLLTDRAPFEGENAVQVVANAVNQKPRALSEVREDVPAGLERVVLRCLAKEPGGRYADYGALRDALMPYSSKEAEAASIAVRASAGWIDYLIALLPAYVGLMLVVGAEAMLVRPLAERTLYSARYHILLLGLGVAYFAIFEGIWGAGPGKWLKGLQVVRADGRRPGIFRALVRIVIPIACVEGVRMPLMMALISGYEWTGFQTAAYVIAAVVCGWIPMLGALRARRENGYATIWDIASGTRVVVKPKAAVRPAIEASVGGEPAAEGAERLGPYHVVKEIVPGEWLAGSDPVLRRRVWLVRRKLAGLSAARRDAARPGRLRWLQGVETAEGTWDAFEAPDGAAFSNIVEGGRRMAWGTLRHWLSDIASEMWEASNDGTLAGELSVDHVWITSQGQAVVLDEPWPEVRDRAEGVGVGEVRGQQRFLEAVAGHVEQTSVPLHARAVLRNLEEGKFEKLSFIAGTLRGVLERPAEVSKGLRAGSIFLLGFYLWVAVFVGYYQAERVEQWEGSVGVLVVISAVAVLGLIGLVQLAELALGRAVSHAVFRLAVVNARGERAGRPAMLRRWVITWLPLFAAMVPAALLAKRAEGAALVWAGLVLVTWLGAAVYAAVNPARGLQDRLAGTWVVRQ